MLCNILMVFLCVPTVKYLLSIPTDRRNVESKTTFRASFRKQLGLPRPPSIQSKSKSKAESNYEPYWADGDWVYYRGESTNRPQPFFLNEGNATEHDECNQICPQFIQDYGFVCGQRYNDTNTKYEHQTFEDYCYLEYQNCYSVSKIWYPVKKGNCTEPMTTQRFDKVNLVTRAATFDVFSNDGD